MNKVAIGMLLVVLVGVSACGAGGTPATPSTATPYSSTHNATGSMVVADAVTVPVRRAALGFQAGGVLVALKVPEGATVKAGDVLAQLDETDGQLAIAQAEANLAQAQAELAKVKAAVLPAKLDEAAQAIKEADALVWRASAQLTKLQTGVTAADIAAAQASLAQTALNLKVAQDNYDQAPKGERSDAAQALAAARQNYAAAQQRLTQLKAGATQNELNAGRAAVSAAQAQRAMAQAQLDLLKNGATQEQIAIAQAGVKAAQAAVEMAKAQLAKQQLIAPFDGTVAMLDLKPGQLVAPDVPVIWLADTSAWQFETDDLTEISVVRIRAGDPATITFDALPEVKLTGQVVRIEAFGRDKQGDVTYTVIVKPDQPNAQLRWNMTALISIEPKQAPGAQEG